MRTLIVAAVIALAAGRARADAPPDRLAAAQAQFLAGEYSAAAMLSGPLTRDPEVPAAVRAEAHRVYGLSLFLLGLRDEAEEYLVAYLRLDPSAHLDPALVPPEAIVFFEDVRVRHAGELLIAKPRPKQNRYFVLNFLPPFGQFQNGDRTTGWILAASETLLLATNVTTYLLLRNMCHDDQTCDDEDTAGMFRTTNIVSGALLIGVYVYGVYDAIKGYRRRGPVEAPLAITPTPGGGGAMVWTSWGF